VADSETEHKILKISEGNFRIKKLKLHSKQQIK